MSDEKRKRNLFPCPMLTPPRRFKRVQKLNSRKFLKWDGFKIEYIVERNKRGMKPDAFFHGYSHKNFQKCLPPAICASVRFTLFGLCGNWMEKVKGLGYS